MGRKSWPGCTALVMNARALMVAREEKHEAEVAPDVVSETFEVLRSLGHSESEARRLVDTALSSKQKFKDVQSLIEAIYQQSQK